jgi:hypothetical protein
VLNHRALFFPQEASMPPNQHPICTVETKDFIPSGPIDWFKNPIPAPDAFEEGNMANISPTIKIDISIKMASLRKSPLELLALLKKSPPIKPSSRNIEIFFPGHTQKFLASIPLSSNIASTPGPTLLQFAKNNDRYIHPKQQPSKPKLTNYTLSGSFTPLPIHHGFPTLYSLTKSRALSASA